MDRRHAASLVVSGVLEGVLSDASAGVLCDQLDALDHAIHNLQPDQNLRVGGDHIPGLEPGPGFKEQSGSRLTGT